MERGCSVYRADNDQVIKLADFIARLRTVRANTAEDDVSAIAITLLDGAIDAAERELRWRRARMVRCA